MKIVAGNNTKRYMGILQKYILNYLRACFRSILKWPLLRIDLPGRILSASALLWFAQLLSSRRALFLLTAAVPPPGPITSSLPKRSLAWPRTAHTDKFFRRKEVVKAISASSVLTWPLLPTCGLAYLTLEMAR